MAKTWRIVLIVSLALNLFFLGLVAASLGVHWAKRNAVNQGRNIMRGDYPDPRALLDPLPAEARQRIKAMLEERLDDAVPVFRHAADARREAYRAFVAERYSDERWERAMAQSRQADLAAIEAMYEISMLIGHELRPEERRLIGENLKRHARRLHDRRPGPEHDFDPDKPDDVDDGDQD